MINQSYKDYFSEYVDEYDRNGNILRLRRRGLTDSRHGGFGNVDDLYMTYSGNKLTKVRDNAVHDAYNGSTDFYTESKEKEYPLTYNNAGSLVSDASRKIAKIQYDSNNNPVRIQFTNGNVTKYVYSATGEKLRVIYQTSVYPENAEIVAIGKTKELSKEEEKCTETVDYLLGGALTLRNGVIDKYQFEEGYCQATPLYYEGKPFAETFTFCYYDQDHLGNIRQVTMDDGTKKGEVIQRMNYYPFGAEFCDNSTKSFVQNHKYNGKEFDNMHGLNTYDYGARLYNPVTARWDRMDQLSEKYYSTSPFAYCLNNPIRFIDPDGRIVGEPQGTEKWKNISPVIPPNKFIGWGYNNIRNCLSLAKKQIGVVGYSAGGGKDPTNMYPYNESKGVNKKQTEKAVNYIKGALEKGIPVIVGVDDADGSPGNYDNTTDHFLVVVGMGNDDNGNYFQVYENATSDKEEGTDPNNKLYYNPESVKIEGQKQFDNSYSQEVRCYIVSQVRVSQKK